MKKAFKFLAALCALTLLASACSFSASTANFADAYTAADSEGAARTTTYGQEDVFYAIVYLANAPDDTEVRAAWYAVDVEGADPETLIDDATIVSSDAMLTFDLANTGMLWPVGSYRVDLYLNGELETSLDFSVH
jgi:hypothetical protein